MTPVVSIVIPTYNRAADLRRALASVFRQTLSDWEVVIVDNHSTDGTAQLVASLGDARLRLLQVHNHGVIALSRNVGIANAVGEYVALLDSDDWWEPRKLELSVQALREGADIVFHDLYLVRSQMQRFFWSRAHTRGVQAPAYDDLLERGNALTNSSVVVRRALLTDVGGFSEDHSLIGWEDYDAWLRVARRTDRFARLPQTLGYYWVGGGNVSSPERTLRYLERFRQLYWPAEGSATRGRRRLPAWYHYGLGRAHHHLGNSVGALEHMRQALRGKLPAAKYAKAFGTAVVAAGRLMTARQQSE